MSALGVATGRRFKRRNKDRIKRGRNIRHLTTIAAVSALAVLAGCVEESGGSVASAPTAAEQACLQRTSIETNNGDVTVIRSSFSEAGTEVIVGVGPGRAPWRCIAYSDGATTRPMSLTNEGTL